MPCPGLWNLGEDNFIALKLPLRMSCDFNITTRNQASRLPSRTDTDSDTLPDMNALRVPDALRDNGNFRELITRLGGPDVESRGNTQRLERTVVSLAFRIDQFT